MSTTIGGTGGGWQVVTKLGASTVSCILTAPNGLRREINANAQWATDNQLVDPVMSAAVLDTLGTAGAGTKVVTVTVA